MMGARVGAKTWARTSDYYLRHTTFGSIVCYQDRVMNVPFLFGGAGGHIISSAATRCPLHVQKEG